MPGTKSRTKRRRKRKAPCRTTGISKVGDSPHDSPPTPPSPTASQGRPTPPQELSPTASQRKLDSSVASENEDSGEDMDVTCEGQGQRILELPGLQQALSQAACCNVCGTGRLILKEDIATRQGLFTRPFLMCEDCSNVTYIPFSTSGESKIYSINERVVFASRCIGGGYSSLEMFCAMCDLPSPISRKTYSKYVKHISEKSICCAQQSMESAREEIRELTGASSDGIADILVSVDGTWQKRGFSSLFGVVFVIAYITGKVIDYRVMSKHCIACQLWETRDHTSAEYQAWKETHVCDINFTGSAPAMKPYGTLDLFKHSLDHKLRYTSLISDGDSKTFSMLQKEAPYGPDHCVVKLDCVGHVQKRLGTALRNLKTQHRGQKLCDGKTIGGAGRLTDELINSLENYYGDAIRRNKGDLRGMVRAVQASLLHSNSTDENPRHHLCPTGENSWCKYQKALAQGKEYHHTKKPLPEAIVQLITPIYARLGSPTVLEKCLDGYTQNANESLHSVVWKFCPKTLFMGKSNVEMACALAVMSFNDGAVSLVNVLQELNIESSPLCRTYLKKKDKLRITKSTVKSSAKGKKARRAVRRRRKGYDDRKKQSEGIVYAPGAFDCPGPSKN